MNSKPVEISSEKAWRVIRAMQTESVSDDLMVVARLSCYMEKHVIRETIQNNGYKAEIRKFKKPFPFNLLPIPSPFYFHLYDINLKNIYHLASSCNSYLMFEVAVINKNRDGQFKNNLISSKNTLYEDFLSLSSDCEKFFICGFDFQSGTSQVVHCNFVPDFLALYFNMDKACSEQSYNL